MSTFALEIAAWIAKTKDDADKVTRYALGSIDGRLNFRSPVGDTKYWIHKPPKGYTGGRFKGNWQMSIGSPASGVLDVIDKDGKATKEAHASVVAVAKAGQVFYIVNNLPYAKRIEQGWSRQAPIGVVMLAVLEWQKIVNKAVEDVRTTSAADFAQGYETYSK